MKILTVVGARPQFVKAAALSRELASRHGVEEILIHTGQHFDHNMSDVFFDEMEIPKPRYNLEINSLNHGAMTGRMLEGIEKIILDEHPDVVLVYGDTNSTIAGALAARKLHVRVGHVEAGLRSFNMRMPEEVNRILCDRISDYLFCPTQTAVDNLRREGMDGSTCRVEYTGDIMQDAAMFYAQSSDQKSTVLRDRDLPPGFVLVTIHREENTNHIERLQSITDALNEIHAQTPVVCPLHPRTRKIMEQHGIKPAFTVLDPVGYFDMISLLKNCSLVMTDSGGLQKEAFFFKRPCVTMRDQTEWVELIESGYNVLAGANKELIINGYRSMRSRDLDFSADLYGGGKAAARIADVLLSE